MDQMAQIVGTSLEKKILRNVPPLKDFPEESCDTTNSFDSKNSEVTREKRHVNTQIQTMIAANSKFDKKVFDHAEQVFLKLSRKRWPSKKEKIILDPVDCVLTEQSLRKSFSDVF